MSLGRAGFLGQCWSSKHFVLLLTNLLSASPRPPRSLLTHLVCLLGRHLKFKSGMPSTTANFFTALIGFVGRSGPWVGDIASPLIQCAATSEIFGGNPYHIAGCLLALGFLAGFAAASCCYGLARALPWSSSLHSMGARRSRMASSHSAHRRQRQRVPRDGGSEESSTESEERPSLVRSHPRPRRVSPLPIMSASRGSLVLQQQGPAEVGERA